MNRPRLFWMLAVVAGVSYFWWTGLQADDGTQVAPPSNRIAELLARIEKLERRVQVLETKPSAIQQSTHAVATTDEWVWPAPPASNPSQPQFGIVYQLKRLIPETTPVNQPAADGKLRFRSGGIEITR